MKLERMDKILAARTAYSRKDAKKLVWQGRVRHNGKIASSPDAKVDLEKDTLELDGKPLLIQAHLYLMMNKPAGVLSAARDPKQPTVLDLVPEQYRRTGLFPAGRLDKDTEGFVLITDDGEFAHRMLSPKKHISKKYVAEVDGEITQDMVDSFEKGITFRDGTECMPATLIPDENNPKKAQVIIREGKFHQVKKMFITQGLRVKKLKRVSIGGFILPENLPVGECRTMLEEEKQLIFL